MTTAASFRIGLTTLAITAAAAGFAPTAAADVTAVRVTGGFGLGFIQYGVGCTYTVVVAGDPGAGVTLQDWVNDTPGGGTFGPVTEDEPGIYTADWRPTVIGRHLVSAGPDRFREGASTVVNVEVGHDFGLVCLTLPETLDLPF
ncbi:hypothetical protein [Nocardia sp. NPDC024068]|uniref:hypothetical protein n=1 Tax=Nocardia sp. NPDC024068 TaxID=3157197 RepID=UPI0033F82A53